MVSQKLPHRVIFDTDPGVDDAMALYFALAHPDIDIVGISTTFGNVSVDQAAINACYLTTLAGHTIPVSRGTCAPLVLPMRALPAHIHGADGLGDLPRRLPVKSELNLRTSAQFIVDMARADPGELTVVAVGPLGNLSLALDLEPRLPQLLREVVLMGGTVIEPGNVSTVAEANIWNDPHAAARVFGAGWKLTMVGLDVTHKVLLPLVLFEDLARHHRHPATDTLLHASRFYTNFCVQESPRLADQPACFGHDVLAFIYLVDPELFELAQGAIDVVTSGPALGQTVFRPNSGALPHPITGRAPQPPTQVCMQVQAEACTALFEHTLKRPWLNS